MMSPKFKVIGMWNRGMCISESIKYSDSFYQNVNSQAMDSKSPAPIVWFPRNFMTLKEGLVVLKNEYQYTKINVYLINE